MQLQDFSPFNRLNTISKCQGKALALFENVLDRQMEVLQHWYDIYAPLMVGSNGYQGIAFDITESDTAFKVISELPGSVPEEVEITVEGNSLTIKGEKKSSRESKGDSYILRGRSTGSFRRTVTLPEQADMGKAKASFSKGYLLSKYLR